MSNNHTTGQIVVRLLPLKPYCLARCRVLIYHNRKFCVYLKSNVRTRSDLLYLSRKKEKKKKKEKRLTKVNMAVDSWAQDGLHSMCFMTVRRSHLRSHRAPVTLETDIVASIEKTVIGCR